MLWLRLESDEIWSNWSKIFFAWCCWSWTHVFFHSDLSFLPLVLFEFDLGKNELFFLFKFSPSFSARQLISNLLTLYLYLIFCACFLPFNFSRWNWNFPPHCSSSRKTNPSQISLLHFQRCFFFLKFFTYPKQPVSCHKSQHPCLFFFQ